MSIFWIDKQIPCYSIVQMPNNKLCRYNEIIVKNVSTHISRWTIIKIGDIMYENHKGIIWAI